MDFKNFSTDTTSPSLDAFAITPGASALARVPRALFIGVGGSITVTTYQGSSVTFTVSGGTVLPLAVTHVTAATASGIVGLV